jgi:hypothetical protein
MDNRSSGSHIKRQGKRKTNSYQSKLSRSYIMESKDTKIIPISKIQN